MSSVWKHSGEFRNYHHPLGGARGGDRAIAVGGVGGVLGTGERAENFLHHYKGLEPCDKLRAL